MEPRGLGKWTPAIIAGGVFALVVGVTIAAGGKDDAAVSDMSITSDVTVVTSSTSSTTSTIPGFTTTTLPFSPISEPLGMGNAGTAVKNLQQRLIDLHFDPGPADGYFGEATRAAVWAYQKLVLGIPVRTPTGGSPPRRGPGCTSRSRSSRSGPTPRARISRCIWSPRPPCCSRTTSPN
ncbi:MAG: peptidoglycan-binding domain-containing protein [Ilumatobacteraceae bacterium]